MTRARTAWLVATALLAGCDEPSDRPHADIGDPDSGRALIGVFGCGACHAIPGIPGARGRVGPPLDGIGERPLIAATLPNEPDNLTAWIRDAPSIRPSTAMPPTGASEEEARDIAAYLYTLR